MKKKTFQRKFGRENLIWDIKDIKDKDKLKKLEEIEIKNDARMGRKNQTSK